MKIIISKEQKLRLIEQIPDTRFVPRGVSDADHRKIVYGTPEQQKAVVTMLSIGSSFIPFVGPYISAGLLGSELYSDYSEAETKDEKQRVIVSYLVGIAFSLGLGYVFKSVFDLGKEGMNKLSQKIIKNEKLTPQEIKVIDDLSKNKVFVKEKVKNFTQKLKKDKQTTSTISKQEIASTKNNLVLPQIGVKGKIINAAGEEFYHGTNFEIPSPSKLNPNFRETSNFKLRQSDPRISSNTGSSGSYGKGVGIYFGKDPDKVNMFNPSQYMREDPYFTSGFIYKMKLKPDAKILKIESGEHIAKISREHFNVYKSKGIDAIEDNNELVLLNPKKVDTWVVHKGWRQPFVATLKDINPKTGKFETVKQRTFWNIFDLDKFYQDAFKTSEKINLQLGKRIQDPNSDKLMIVDKKLVPIK